MHPDVALLGDPMTRLMGSLAVFLTGLGEQEALIASY